VSSTQIAVLLTCHNRVERTLACLASLVAQSSKPGEIKVVLVDAGSVDGTVEQVRRHYPAVAIIEQSPDLYWNGGMRAALAHAHEFDPDYYLWLNDDVELDPDAVQRLLECDRQLAAARPAPVISVGTTRDPQDGEPTYGGVIRPDRSRRMRYQLVRPSEHPQQAETMNGNCVLVPREVVERVGNLAAAYTHGMGDYDYGHRAHRAGCEVWVAPGTFGTCSRNAAGDRAVSLAEFRQRATSPTGGLPPREWLTFVRRWGGPLWPAYAVSPYIRRFTSWTKKRG
jgi:GT2 family glycosyltransferase